jgi:hypothetical protein
MPLTYSHQSIAALESLESHPGYLVLMEKIQALLESDRRSLESCPVERVKEFQGAAQRTRRILGLREEMLKTLREDES